MTRCEGHEESFQPRGARVGFSRYEVSFVLNSNDVATEQKNADYTDGHTYTHYSQVST